MLSLANVSPGHGATYYKTENYYSREDAKAYSKWAGAGAEHSGLSGAVEHHTFTRLLAGTHPTIEVGGTKANRRAGLDMTFSAPKSVSIQALVFGDTRLVEAHRKAVDEALRFAETHYALYRDGPKGARVKVKGKGLLVAQFEHDTSRLKDPQLHTHNVVLNRIVTSEGTVKALFADEIYRNSVLIGMVYQNSLARQVKELGFDVRLEQHGTFELEGYQPAALKAFSKRKEQIDSFAPDSYRHTRELVLKDRKAKDGPQLREDLVEAWEVEAKAAGVAPLSPSEKAVRERPLPLEKVMDDALSLATLRSAVFRREDVLRGALEIGLGRFSLKSIEKAFEDSVGAKVLPTKSAEVFTSRTAVERDLETRRMVEDGRTRFCPIARFDAIETRLEHLVSLDRTVATEALSRSDALRAGLPFETPRFGAARDQFVRALEEGRRLPLAEITLARVSLIEDLKDLPKSQRRDARALAANVLAPLERAFLAPTRGQSEAIRATLSTHDQVVIWQGVAGAGKTFSVRQIVEESTKTGIEVRGFAPSAAAALQLQSEAGIEATTLQSHILRREQRNENPKLWIVDEAGMVSAADMHALLKKARDAQARVLLVGDTAQLSPVDAGNPFADLQKATKTTFVRLDESLRQKDPDLQKAVAHMNSGNMVRAVGALEGAIQEVRSGRGRVKAAARSFLEAPEASREGTLLLARTNKTRAELTERVRDGLKKHGVLRNPTAMDTFERVDVPKSRQEYASSYIAGGILVPNKRYRSLGLEKDGSYEIERVDTFRNTLTVRNGDRFVHVDLARTNNFSLFMRSRIEVAEGDQMIWNRNVKARNQLNNHGFVVEKVSDKGVTIRTDDGKTRLLDVQERQHMEHAWALTIYKSQGRTTSTVIQVDDSKTSARDLLVSVTRAANAAQIVTPSKDALTASVQREDSKVIAAEEVLPNELNQSDTKSSSPSLEKPQRTRGLSRGRRL